MLLINEVHNLPGVSVLPPVMQLHGMTRPVMEAFINISNYNKPIQVNKFTNNVQTTFTFSSSIFVILWPKECVTRLMF